MWIRNQESQNYPVIVWTLGPRAVQPDDVGDHPRGEPRGLLPDVAGGACERGRLQHPAAEHRRAPLRQFIVCLAQVLCLVSTCQEIRLTPRPWKTETRRVCCQQESNKLFNLKTLNQQQNKIQISFQFSKWTSNLYSIRSLSVFKRRKCETLPQ